MPTPLMWQLHGPKSGDNQQLSVIAAELERRFDWRSQTRQLRFRRTELLTNVLLGPTLTGLNATQSDELAAPWPQVILTAGRRNEPVARWLQKRAPHPVAIVHVGRPWARPERFDLIATTCQYFLEPAANTFTMALPLQAAPNDTPLPEFELQQIWTDPRLLRCAVLIGGNSGRTRFTANRMRRLVEILATWSEQQNAAVTLVTSPRTPAPALEALRAACVGRSGFRLFCWQPDAGENPYPSILTSAQRLVVTAESASMLAEAATTGTPLSVIDVTALGPAIADWLAWPALTHRIAQIVGPRRMRRDVRRLSAMLIDLHAAQELSADGELSFSQPGDYSAHQNPAQLMSARRSADLALLTERIRALVPAHTRAG